MSVDVSKAVWFKSSHSSAGSECVEVAHLSGGLVGVRDSKAPDGGVLVFASPAWARFLAAARGGEFRDAY
ncbi:DUF397 domain-containing protein [Nocardia harenae]|uniref:DUF397 domain-containing protein n=1 Tax=Nocardia harenae TaxID=358707 RepID=UPI000A0603AB|nr:DUF397 domain-containing protein [Nocardia harenae]